MKRFTSLLAAVVFLMASSCQKSKELEPEKATVDKVAAIEVVDGRLKFASKAAYDETMTYLVAHQGELPAWEKQFKGYVSMRSAYESITAKQYEEMVKGNLYDKYQDVLTLIPSGDDKEIVVNIEDRVASTVTSNRGLVQIGSDVYKIGREKVVKFSNYSSSMETNQYNNSDAAKGIVISTVKRNYYRSPSVRGARISGDDDHISEYWVGSSKRRLIGTIYDWNATDVDGVHIGLQTKHQRRFLGTWFAESISSIGLNGNGSYQTYHNGIPQGGPTSFNTGDYRKNDDNYINYTLKYGGDNTYDYISVSSLHFGTCTDGNYRTVTF